ncbi:major capsid protein [Roseiconus lacunae]|uniref:major capsid protein n=1 Tax=Roseiconus lacunae TaxID=2605694 RepID=UPI001E3333AD|nr:major capsid protein [Roseiconus lacunae]MCD0460060.1 major capsid protein [Roseiconus lacunae]
MPDFDKSDANLRYDLATFCELDTEMNRRGYIATRLFPTFQVPRTYGKFGVIDLASLLASVDADTKRGPRGDYNTGDYKTSQRSYQTQEHGWKERVDDHDRNMYSDFFEGSSFSADEVATARAWAHLLHTLDKRVIAKVNALPAGQKQSVTNEWDDYENGTPIDDIEAVGEKIFNRTGVYPDTLTLSRQAWRKLRRHPQIKAEIQSGGAGDRTTVKDVTTELVAEVLDLRQVLVAGAVGNSARAPKKAVIETVWPKAMACLSVAAQTDDFKEPCFGRTFHWGGDGSEVQGERLIGVVEEYRDEDRRKDIIRVRHETDEFVVYQEMAEQLNGIMTVS